MAIAYRGGFTDGGAANPTGTINVSLAGSNATANDVAILTIYSRDGTTPKPFGTVTGWTQLQKANTANGGEMYVGWRLITAADVTNGYAGSWAPTTDANATTGITVAVFSGVNTSSPIRTSATPVAGGASNVPDPPSVNITSGDTVVCMYGKMDDDGGTHTAPSTPGSFVLGPQWSTTSGTDGCSGTAYLLAYASTSCDPGVFTTASGGLSTYWYACTLALIPATATTWEGSFTCDGISAVTVVGASDYSTFGNTAAGSGSYADCHDIKWVARYQLTESAAVSKLRAYISNGASACAAKAVIYSDNAGEPDALQGAAGTEVAFGASQAVGWVELPFGTPIGLTPGWYWLGIHGNASATTLDLKNDSTTLGTSAWNGDTYSDGPTATFGAHTNDTRRNCLYAVYRLAAATWEGSFTVDGISAVGVVGSVTQAVWEGSFTVDGISAVAIAGAKAEAVWEGSFTCDGVSTVAIAPFVTQAIWEGAFSVEGVSSVAIAAGLLNATWEGSFACDGISAVAIVASPVQATWEGSFSCEAVSAVAILATKSEAVWEGAFSCEGVSTVTVAASKTEAVWEGSFTCDGVTAVAVVATAAQAVWEGAFTCDGVTVVTVTPTPTEAVWQGSFTCDGISAVVVVGGKVGGVTTHEGSFTCDGLSGVVITPTAAEAVWEGSFVCDGVSVVSVVVTPTQAAWEASFTVDAISAVAIIGGEVGGTTTWEGAFACDGTTAVAILLRVPDVDLAFHLEHSAWSGHLMPPRWTTTAQRAAWSGALRKDQ